MYELELWERLYYKGIKTKYFISTRGNLENSLTGKRIKGFVSNSGYKRYTITISGKKFKISAHRYVAMTFITIPKKFIKAELSYENLVPNHKDGNKLHNHVHNLEWMTVKENTIDALNTGLIKSIGENSHLAKMDEKTAIKCCELLSKGKGFDYISSKLGVSRKSVIHIKAGECWKHISKNYKFPKNDKAKPNTIPLETIHGICKLLELKTMKDAEIGAIWGVSREYVKDIRTHKRQKKISDQYNF